MQSLVPCIEFSLVVCVASVKRTLRIVLRYYEPLCSGSLVTFTKLNHRLATLFTFHFTRSVDLEENFYTVLLNSNIKTVTYGTVLRISVKNEERVKS